jgi:hypothetical protein
MAEIAKQDTYGVRDVGGDATVRVQIKAGHPIPPDVELEDEGARGEKDDSKEKSIGTASTRKTQAKD